MVSTALAIEDGFGYFFVSKGDFRYQDDVGAPGNAAVEGDPAGMTTHDLEDHDAFMAVGGGVQAVESVHHRGDGGVESEGHGGRLEIVVNGLGHADHWHSFLLDLEGGGEGTITSDDNEGAHVESFEGGFGLVHDFGRDPLDVVLADDGDEVPFVDGPEDGAAEFGDAGRFDRVQYHVIAGRQESFKAVAEADNFPAQLMGGSGHTVDDGVEAGAVAAAVQNSNTDFIAHRW